MEGTHSHMYSNYLSIELAVCLIDTTIHVKHERINKSEHLGCTNTDCAYAYALCLFTTQLPYLCLHFHVPG